MENEERTVEISLQITERFESFFKDSGLGTRDEVYLEVTAKRKGYADIVLDTRIKVKSEDNYGKYFAVIKSGWLEAMFGEIYRRFEQAECVQEEPWTAIKETPCPDDCAACNGEEEIGK